MNYFLEDFDKTIHTKDYIRYVNRIRYEEKQKQNKIQHIDKAEYQFYGLTKSNDNKHKYEAIFTNRETGRVKHIKFGAKGYRDYIWYQANTTVKNAIKHKRAYFARNIHNIDFGNPMNASFWSASILWNRVNVEYSLNNTLKVLDILGYL